MKGLEERGVVVGPSRSGTTLLCSVLAQLWIDFGLPSRAWNPDSGYFEHALVLNVYGELRKSDRFASISDRLSHYFLSRAVRSLSRLLRSAKAVKYPPISSRLPHLVACTGFKPVLAVCARRFEPYAISRIRKEGVGWNTCKCDYLEIYTTAILQLQIYRGCVISYDTLVGSSPKPALRNLQALTGAPLHEVEHFVKKSAGSARSIAPPSTEDTECRALFDQLVALQNRQHL